VFVSGGTFYIYDKSSSTSYKPSAGFLSRRWKTKSVTFCPEPKASSALPTATHARARQSVCLCAGISWQVSFHTSAKRHPRVGERARSVDDGEAGALDPTDETSREYERVVDPKYLEEIRAEAKTFFH